MKQDLIFSICVAMFAVTSVTGWTADTEFKSLLNGRDISHWETLGNWIANSKGELELRPRPGETGYRRFGSYLFSKKQYRNFIITFEYRHGIKGNSGLHFRMADRSDPLRSGFEAQIFDTHGKRGRPTPHDCGGIIGNVAPDRHRANRAGQWNKMSVTMKGNRVTVVLNGKPVVNANLANGRDRPLPDKGFIAFQDYGRPFFLRKIRIRELD